jgi:DNA repair protein RadC
MGDAENETAGHRARLRDRVRDFGPESLADYELLEFILTLAIPRVDTKQQAKALLREFGSIGGVLNADVAALRRINGVGASAAGALKAIRETALRMLRNDIQRKPVLASWQALLDYLRADMAYGAIERVRVLYLDSKNTLIQDEIASEGTIDEAAVHVREIIRRAIDVGASGMILVHNHPSGDPQPSRADIQLTRDIIEAGRRLKIAVHDHVIIGTEGHASLRALGLM